MNEFLCLSVFDTVLFTSKIIVMNLWTKVKILDMGD